MIDNANKLGSVYVTESTKPSRGASLAAMSPKFSGVSKMARLYVPDLAKLFANNPLIKQLTDPTAGYVDFLLTSVTEPQAEKYQVFDVVGDEYAAYFYGKRPAIYVFSGMLYNTKEDDWRHAFMRLYSDILRGTQLQRYGRYVTVYYDDQFVSGSMLSLTQELRAETQLSSTFTFELLVKRIQYAKSTNAFRPNKIDFDGALIGYAQPSVAATQVTVNIK